VDELFDAIVVSCDVGKRKPDPRIFHLMLGMLGGLAPEDVLFVDDMEENVAGARRVGMAAILADEDCDVTIRCIEALLAGQQSG
jgi:putative hydrolase of the HAD superfamily